MTDLADLKAWYFLVANLLGFMIAAYDKRRAITAGRRVSEANLFIIALVGGAVGVYLAMKLFRHKTRKAAFVFGIPVLIIVNLALYIYLTLRA